MGLLVLGWVLLVFGFVVLVRRVWFGGLVGLVACAVEVLVWWFWCLLLDCSVC